MTHIGTKNDEWWESLYVIGSLFLKGETLCFAIKRQEIYIRADMCIHSLLMETPRFSPYSSRVYSARQPEWSFCKCKLNGVTSKNSPHTQGKTKLLPMTYRTPTCLPLPPLPSCLFDSCHTGFVSVSWTWHVLSLLRTLGRVLPSGWSALPWIFFTICSLFKKSFTGLPA